MATEETVFALQLQPAKSPSSKFFVPFFRDCGSPVSKKMIAESVKPRLREKITITYWLGNLEKGLASENIKISGIF